MLLSCHMKAHAALVINFLHLRFMGAFQGLISFTAVLLTENSLYIFNVHVETGLFFSEVLESLDSTLQKAVCPFAGET